MKHSEAKKLTDKLTPLNRVKLSLYAAELSYPIYKKYDENDTVVIGAINATRTYLESPCKETAGAAWSAAGAAAGAAWSAGEAAAGAANFATYSAHSAASAAAYAAWSATSAARTAWSAKDAASAICSACEADDTIEAKIMDYAEKLLAERCWTAIDKKVLQQQYPTVNFTIKRENNLKADPETLNCFFHNACLRGELDKAKWLQSLGDVEIRMCDEDDFNNACSRCPENVRIWLKSIGEQAVTKN